VSKNPTLNAYSNPRCYEIRVENSGMDVRPAKSSFICSWDNSDRSFGWGLRTPNLGEEEAVGGRGYRSKDCW